MIQSSKIVRNTAQVRRRTAVSRSAITSRSTSPKSVSTRHITTNYVRCIQFVLNRILAILWNVLLFVYSSLVATFWISLSNICLFSLVQRYDGSRPRLHFGNVGETSGNRYRSRHVENRWLHCHKGPVILSNQATPRIVRLYRSLGFRLKFLSAPRRISCTGDRTPAPEVLALRNLQ